MNANDYDKWMRGRPKPASTSRIHPTDNLAAERIMPGLKAREETRMDRILKPYRGRSYEGPTEPEVV